MKYQKKRRKRIVFETSRRNIKASIGNGCGLNCLPAACTEICLESGPRDQGTQSDRDAAIVPRQRRPRNWDATARVSIGRYLYHVVSAQLPPCQSPHSRGDWAQENHPPLPLTTGPSSLPRDYYNNRYGIRTALAKGKGRRAKLTEKQNQSTIHGRVHARTLLKHLSAPRFQIPLSRP